MASRLTLRIVTPPREILRTEVDEVQAPGATGSFGVRPGHTAFLTTLDAGALIFTDGGRREAYAVIDGFVEVMNDQVIVLAEEAVPVLEIDLEAEERAMQEARARMAGLPPESDTYRRESAIIRRAAARAMAARLR